jgi:hypothetical protein
MTTPQTAVELAHRLKSVDWAGNYDHTPSRVKLMQEYLRRASLWAQHLDRTPEWPFFDIAEAIDPAVRANPDLVAHATKGLSFRTKRIAAWALHFAELRTIAPQKIPHLDDPYEPLIVMFERGGGYTTEHNRIEVDLAQFPSIRWTDYNRPDPIVPIADTALLDDLDRAGRQ